MKEQIIETLVGITLRSGNEYSVKELLGEEDGEVLIFKNSMDLECRVERNAIAMKVYDIKTIQIPKSMFEK